MKTALNAEQVRDLLNDQILNNMRLSKSNKLPIAYELFGDSGIGKTSVVKEIAKELNYNYVRLNVAEILVEDLIGLPIYEYKVRNDKGDIEWVSDKTLPYFVNAGWHPVGSDFRTGYAKPKWIQGKEDRPVLLFLDDFNRSNPMMVNACMTLIDEQKYTSWSLPEGSTIILSCNPDNGEFMVQSEDEAHATRRLKIEMKFDVDIWAKWAESYKLDNRCINFILKNPEVVEGIGNSDNGKGDKLKKGNIRIWTKYFDAISGYSSFKDSLSMIMNIGGGSLPAEHITHFVSFINNGLDNLWNPNQLLQDSKASIAHFKSTIKEGDNRRKDIAAIFSKRLVNYALSNANETEYTKQMVEVYGDLIESGYLSSDLILLSLKKLCTSPKFSGLTKRTKIVNLLLGK